MKRFRSFRYILRIAALFVALLVFFSHAVVHNAAEGKLYSRIGETPYRRAGLLLGTSPYFRTGAPNQFFRNRIEAAAALIAAGRIEVIVVSGDNRHQSYNEPRYMRDALIDRGVPPERIVMDFAGLRTLDSVVRMNRVFLQDRFVIISQEFQVERALFLAAEHDIDAIGFIAADAEGIAQTNVRIREFAARVQAVLDVYILGTSPRHLGDAVPIVFPDD